MAKRKMSWGPSNPLWQWQHRNAKRVRYAVAGAKYVRRRVNTMARRGYRRYGRRRGSGGFGLGRLLSPKNLMFTAAGLLIAPRVLNVDPKLGAAAGGFLGAGPIGAIAAYLAAPFLANVTGGSSSSQNGGF